MRTAGPKEQLVHVPVDGITLEAALAVPASATGLVTRTEDQDYELRLDILLLTQRVLCVSGWLQAQPQIVGAISAA